MIILVFNSEFESIMIIVESIKNVFYVMSKIPSIG